MGTTEDAEDTELGFSSAFGGFGVFGGFLVFLVVLTAKTQRTPRGSVVVFLGVLHVLAVSRAFHPHGARPRWAGLHDSIPVTGAFAFLGAVSR